MRQKVAIHEFSDALEPPGNFPPKQISPLILTIELLAKAAMRFPQLCSEDGHL